MTKVADTTVCEGSVDANTLSKTVPEKPLRGMTDVASITLYEGSVDAYSPFKVFPQISVLLLIAKQIAAWSESCLRYMFCPTDTIFLRTSKRLF